MDFEIPSYLESPPDQLPPSPPVTSRIQELPFDQIAWENFERICLRVARREADIRQCFLYGERGQGQRGIDFIGYAGDLLHRQVRVYQCKREEKLGPAKIKEAVDKFLAGQWDPKPNRFVVCSSIPLRSTEVQDEIERQVARLGESGIEFVVWDTEELSERLKSLPDVVDDFFGRAWVKAFNGPEVADQLPPRLSGLEVITLRKRLLTLYMTLFDRHDPGLPSSLDRRVSSRERYIPPDVGEHRPIVIDALPPPASGSLAERMSEELESRGASRVHGQLAPLRREHPLSQREFNIEAREPVLQWLGRGSRTVVLGEPGIGKSALLRFVALTLLDPESANQDLARAWGERLPLWISFSAWTRAISSDDAINLEDFLFTWLHQHSADDLKPLLGQALRDRRLLLLIDGLDERYHEAAATVALDRLDTFLAGRDIPVVLTTRPIGYERLRRPSGEWRHGRLLDFNDQQVRSLAQFWFSWLALPPDASDATAVTTAKGAVQVHTEEFLAQLAAAPRVRDLARVPLLLTLLIQLSRFGGRLPEHRIKAYDKMVEYLLTEHPALRRRAAGLARWEDPVLPDDTKEVLARLALRIQQDHGGGYAPTETCRDVFTESLSDPSDGPGYPAFEARAKANQLIQNVRQGLGLLVERGVDELGFIHLTLQEYLAAWAIARKSETEQATIVGQHWKDPRWREVILSLLGLWGVVRRDRRRIEALVEHLRSMVQSELERLQLWPLLAETVFGDLGISPARARPLAEEILDVAEQSPFASTRRTLAPMVVQGLRSEHLREIVSKRLGVWFPARSEYIRKDILLRAGGWQPADDLERALLITLGDEDDGCRVAAATSLAGIYRGDTIIGELLLSCARRSVRPEFREATLVALARGWASLKGVAEVLEAGLTDRHPGVQLSAALGRVDLAIHDDRDFEVLWKLGDWDSGLSYSRRDEIPAGIIRGWPRSERVKERCREALLRDRRGSDRREERFDAGHAARILIEMFPGDDEIAALFAEDIQREEFPFASAHYEVWRLLAAHFRRHPALIEPVTSFLQRRQQKQPAIYPGPEEVDAIVVAGKRELRDQLMRSFPADTPIRAYWATAALVEAWPEDEDVKEFLRSRLDGPVKFAAEVAPFINRLGVAPAEQRKRLLSILRDPDAGRVWIVFSTLLQITASPDEEILDAGLASLTKHRWSVDDESMKHLLIEAFPTDRRVESLAWELWNEPDAFSGFLASVYHSHPSFRSLLLAATRPADSIIRGQIAHALGAGYVRTSEASSILKTFLHEQDAVVRTTAVVSLAAHAQRDETLLRWLVDILTMEIAALGMHYEDRRAAAVAGLLRLNRLDLVRDATDHDGKPAHLGRGLQPWKQNPPLIRECLRAWRQVKDTLGEGVFQRFWTGPEYFWEVAAPWVDEFPQARTEFEEYLRGAAGKQVGANTLQAIARLFSKSVELRETCLESLRESELRPDPTLTAARLLGEHFGGESAALERLRTIQPAMHAGPQQKLIRKWRVLLALCYGWAQAEEVQEWLRVSRENWVGMPWHISLHLHRIAADPEQVLRDIEAILGQNKGRSEFRDEEVARALTLWVGEERNRSQLRPLLDAFDPCLVATALGLLSASGPLGSDLRHAFELLFEKELKAETGSSKVGLDLSVGTLRTVAESILDALS